MLSSLALPVNILGQEALDILRLPCWVMDVGK